MAWIRRKTSDRNGGSGGILEKIKALKKRRNRNPNFSSQLYLKVLIVGYVFFLTSKIWMPGGADLIEATAYYSSTICGSETLNLTKWEYSESQDEMLVVLERSSQDVLGSSPQFTAKERTYGEQQIETVIEDPDYLVLKLTKIPKGWKEVSIHVEGSGESSKTEARIYTNKEAVARVKNIPNTLEGYQIARLEAQVDYDDTQMGTKREKLEKLEAEIKELNQIISQLEGQDYPTEEEAQSSKERIDQARAKISTDEAQIEQTQKEAEELRIRTENLQQQIRDLKK